MSTGATTTIRAYRPGDPPPPADPKRYKSSAGYIRLRWYAAPRLLVECYEHRWVMQCFDPALQVHHKNGVRDDNRPENLEVVTTSEHAAEHRTIDWDRACDLYESGLATTEVGTALGIDPSQVSRILASRGVQTRTLSEAQARPLDMQAIRQLHTNGVPARRIAQLLGVSGWAIDWRIKAMGLEPHRPGRPTDAQRRAAEAAINEYTAAGR